MIRVFLSVVSVILLVSCGGDEDFCEIRDFTAPESQLQTEIQGIKDYLTENQLTAEEHPSGIHYIINQAGTGRTPDGCTTVTVQYIGTLFDGSEFDASRDKDGNLITVDFFLANLIPGWQIGLPLIREEGSITLFIPSGYAYGDLQIGDIPPNSTLIFDVYMKSVRNQ